MQREVTIQDGKIVIRVDGAAVRYPLSVVQKRVKELSVELDTWQEYERRLLTPCALDAGEAPANLSLFPAEVIRPAKVTRKSPRQ